MDRDTGLARRISVATEVEGIWDPRFVSGQGMNAAFFSKEAFSSLSKGHMWSKPVKYLNLLEITETYFIDSTCSRLHFQRASGMIEAQSSAAQGHICLRSCPVQSSLSFFYLQVH